MSVLQQLVDIVKEVAGAKGICVPEGITAEAIAAELAGNKPAEVEPKKAAKKG